MEFISGTYDFGVVELADAAGGRWSLLIACPSRNERGVENGMGRAVALSHAMSDTKRRGFAGRLGYVVRRLPARDGQV
jgi:hypothetical protein